MRGRPGRDLVALLLALAILIAVAFTSVSLLYGVIVNERRTVTDAAVNLMTMLFGGIIAILGGYVGAGKDDDDPDEDT